MAASFVASPAVRRVYIQLRAGCEPRVFEAYATQVARLGRIHLSGVAPETDATGCWFEVHLRSPVRDFAHLRKRLADVGVEPSGIHSVFAVTQAGDGRTFAKQLALFGRL